MMETWHPLGVVGVISAFNFPVAVWAWNAALALVCGNSVRLEALGKDAAQRAGDAEPVRAGAATVRRRGRPRARWPFDRCSSAGARSAKSSSIIATCALVSATGSTAMGRDVGPRLAARFARALLELGGNNAAIVCPSADLDLTVRAVAFAAMGTAGQRCTSLRRLIVHEDVYDALVARLEARLSLGHGRRSARGGDPGRPAHRPATRSRRWAPRSRRPRPPAAS